MEGKHQGRIQDLKLGWGPLVKNSSRLASCQQLKSKKKINNLILREVDFFLGGGDVRTLRPLNPPVIVAFSLVSIIQSHALLTQKGHANIRQISVILCRIPAPYIRDEICSGVYIY